MKTKTWYKLLYSIVRPFIGLYYPMKFYGRENIPDGACLVCSNHSSAIDPFFLAFALTRKRPTRPMAKESLLKIPVIGKLLEKVGTFPVRRGESDIHAVKFALEQLRSGECVMMFPEGTRVKSREEGVPKTGAAMLAYRTGAPIVPVYVPIKKKVLRINHVYIGKPIYMKVEGKRATTQDYERMTAELMDQIYGCGDGI